mmetsp:Transcript_10638/g.18496  ORF Transcript_10638/g.18496 Transcript_10638/m.18496 type:complete len:335 (+) Transcript_10638:1-1005(+)
MHCADKTEQICCKDSAFRTQTCVPLYYCSVAVGEKPPGPMPPCGAVQLGDPAKCKKDEDQLRTEAGQMLSMCHAQLQELYDLQADLGKCVAEVGEAKKGVEQEHDGLKQLQQEAVDCEQKKSEAQAKKSMPWMPTGSEKEVQGTFCPEETEALVRLSAKYALTQGKCLTAKMSVEVSIPEIHIEVPEITVGVVHEGSFSVDVPDFSVPNFDGSIVLPGGGGKLNEPGAHGDGTPVKPLTLQERKANVRQDIAKCEEAEGDVKQKKQELVEKKSAVADQKAKSCADTGSLLETRTSPEVSIAIEAISMTKMAFSLLCPEIGGVVDEFISVLKRCP